MRTAGLTGLPRSAHSYKCENDGCSWVGSVGDVAQHLQAQVRSPASPIILQGRNRSTDENMRLAQCLYREVSCSLCYAKMREGERKEHELTQCPEALVLCPRGGSTCGGGDGALNGGKMRRRELAAHEAVCATHKCVLASPISAPAQSGWARALGRAAQRPVPRVRRCRLPRCHTYTTLANLTAHESDCAWARSRIAYLEEARTRATVELNQKKRALVALADSGESDGHAEQERLERGEGARATASSAKGKEKERETPWEAQAQAQLWQPAQAHGSSAARPTPPSSDEEPLVVSTRRNKRSRFESPSEAVELTQDASADTDSVGVVEPVASTSAAKGGSADTAVSPLGRGGGTRMTLRPCLDKTRADLARRR